MTLAPEVKNILDWIVEKLIAVVNLEPFRQKISRYINQEYMRGIEEAEVKFEMNFIPNNEDVSFLDNYVFDTMKQHTDAIGESLRGELQRGLMNKENVAQLKKRIKDVFKDKKFTDRLKTVMRTEKLRANNYGSLAGAIQSGLPLKKYVDIVRDDVTSKICLEENKEYGKESQAISLDKEFVVRADNKTIRAQAPPFHPNCRTVIRFVEVEG